MPSPKASGPTPLMMRPRCTPGAMPVVSTSTRSRASTTTVTSTVPPRRSVAVTTNRSVSGAPGVASDICGMKTNWPVPVLSCTSPPFSEKADSAVESGGFDWFRRLKVTFVPSQAAPAIRPITTPLDSGRPTMAAPVSGTCPGRIGTVTDASAIAP